MSAESICPIPGCVYTGSNPHHGYKVHQRCACGWVGVSHGNHVSGFYVPRINPAEHKVIALQRYRGLPPEPKAPHVYVARQHTTGLVKVGWSCDLPTRMLSLGAELLACVPGDADGERILLHFLRQADVEPAQGKEWFSPGSEPVALAALNRLAGLEVAA